MKAVLMTAPVDPEVLKLSDIPKPEVADPSAVLVKLHAAGVNPIDAKVRKGNTRRPSI
jgi:NADPH2:quinone reductase